MFANKSLEIPTAEDALAGREQAMRLSSVDVVSGNSMREPFPSSTEQVVVAMGCFWGAEKAFWSLKDKIYSTSVGYAAGHTPNPTYREVCSGMTGHTEVVRVIYYSDKISLEEILQNFWESHNPTQGMRQGNDVGTQYRSGIYTSSNEHFEIATTSRGHYQKQLTQAGLGLITTEIKSLVAYYFAEEEHQQYLHKNPTGYCGLGGCNVSYF